MKRKGRRGELKLGGGEVQFVVGIWESYGGHVRQIFTLLAGAVVGLFVFLVGGALLRRDYE